MLTTPERHPGEDPSVVTNILERCDLLRDLPQEARATAIAAVRTKTLLAGELLLRRGARGRDAYIVLSGTLEVLDEDENPVAVIQVGELIDDRLALADLLIEPPVDGVDNLDFRAALPLVDRAYAHTCDQLETWLETADAQAVA